MQREVRMVKKEMGENRVKTAQSIGVEFCRVERKGNNYQLTRQEIYFSDVLGNKGVFTLPLLISGHRTPVVGWKHLIADCLENQCFKISFLESTSNNWNERVKSRGKRLGPCFMKEVGYNT